MPMPRDAAIVDLRFRIAGALPESGPRVEDVPAAGKSADRVERALKQMDAAGITRAMIEVSHDAPVSRRALARHPDRFLGAARLDPHGAMEEVRRVERLHADVGLAAVWAAPSAAVPAAPIDDRAWYPLYAKCVELGVPFCCSVGVPAGRGLFSPQKVERVDAVCCFFPELVFVMTDGGEPWTALAVQLLERHPNLHWATSGVEPGAYPVDLVRYANSGGAGRVMYGGAASGAVDPTSQLRALSRVPFRDAVWRDFLGGNARRVFRLPDTT